MSTNVTPTIDVELDTTEVTALDSTGQLTAPVATEIDLSETTSNVEGYKKEYSIIGDGLYASLSVDEAPLWLTSLVDAVVNASIANGMTNYDLLVQDVRNAIDSIDVAKNTYVQQIDVTALVDGIVTSKLETLNATYEGAFATKAELSTTVATAKEALAQDITDLSVGFGEDLTSRITAVQQAYADADSALADDITALESAFDDQEANLSAIATATEGLQTYVGLTSTGEPTGTGLLSELAILQKQADGTVDTFTGMHELLLNDMDGNEDTTELLVNQWPYALWVPMEGTVNPTMTTRTAYKDDVAAQYDIEPHTVYKNTANNTFWEYHPIAAGGWEEITEPEYASRTTTVRDLHVGDAYIRYQYELGQKQYVESYKFIKNSPDDTAPYMTDSEGYGWAVVTDNAAESAYIEALNAYALADGKVSQFYAWYHPDNTAPYNQTFNESTADEYTVLGSSFRHWFKHNTLYTKEAAHDPSNEFLNQILAVAVNSNAGTDFYNWATSLSSDGYAYGDHNKTGSISSADATAFAAIVSGAADLLNDPNGWYHRWEAIVRPSLMSQPWFTASVYLQEGWDVNTNVSQGDIVNAYNAVTRDYTIFSHDGTAWGQSGPEGIISKSTYFVNLENEVLGSEGHVANSIAQLKIDSEAYADNESARVENKFAYDSTVILNGQHYKSGFGLNSSGVTQPSGADGTETNAFDSEFWVNAERFVLKSPSYPEVSASFTVTDSGMYLSTDYTEATRNEARGTYASTTQYYKGDIVTYNGSSYLALKSLKGVTPTNGTDWQLFAAEGTKYKEIFLYQNATSSPTVPAITAGFSSSTGASSATGSWTTDPSTPSAGSLTWRTSLTLFQSQGSSTWEAVDSSWSSAVQLTGLSGEATDTIYTVSTTAPSTPAASSTVPSGWSATLPTKVDNIWVSIGTKGVGVTNYTWGAPIMLSEHTANLLLAQKALPWPTGTGNASTEGGTWGANGDTVEQSRIVTTDPFGGQSVVWRAVNNGTDNGPDGGFASPWVTHAGTDKLYRFSVFMRQQNNNGTKYFGLYSSTGVRYTGTTTTTNPYFFAADLPSSNEWYMLVGYLKPFGSGDYTVADSGIYRVSDGVKVGSTNNFIFGNAADTSLLLRCYQYYNTSSSSDIVDFWGPRIDVMDDRAPTINDLLRKSVQGQTFKEIFLYANGATAPALPSISGSYNSSTGAAEDEDGWVVSPSAPTTGQSTWRTSLTLVKVSDQTPWVNHDSLWNTAIKVSGHDGVSYTGTTEYYKLTNSTTAPAKYSSGTTIDTGWSTSPSSPTSTNRYLWNFNRNSRSDGTFTDSAVSLITSMVKSISSITEKYQLGTSATSAPTGTWQTSIANAGTISDTKPYLWNQTTIAYTDGSTSSTVTTLIAAKGAEGYTPVKGTDYFDGAPGPAGAGFYGGSYTSISTTTSTITTRFKAIAGRDPVVGDVFTQTNTSATPNTSTSKRFDGTNWVAPNLVVTGDMIVEGGISADNIAVGSLSSIKADLGTVTAGKLQNSAGTFILDLTAGTITIKTA